MGLSPMILKDRITRGMGFGATARAAMDFSARSGANSVLINDRRPLGSTIELVSKFNAGRLNPAPFQHAFVSLYMQNDRGFPEMAVKDLQTTRHGDYKDTAIFLRKAIDIPGGIDIALYPVDVPRRIENAAWESKFAGNAFQFVTENDVNNYKTPPYIKSIYSVEEKKDTFDPSRGLQRLNDVLDHVENPVVIKTAIKRSIHGSAERREHAATDFDKKFETGYRREVTGVAMENTRLPVKKVILDIIKDAIELQYTHTFDEQETCDFLERNSSGYKSGIKDKDLAAFKKATRRLLERSKCLKWHK